MNLQLIDTMLDYFRIIAYAVVVLTSLRGIAKRKFTNWLFVGDVFLALILIFTVVFLHLFEVVPASTLTDDILLTIGAAAWALIHFIAMLKENGNGRKENYAS